MCQNIPPETVGLNFPANDPEDIRFNKSTCSEGLHLKHVWWHRKDDSHLFMVIHNPPATKGVAGVDEAVCT